LHHEWKNVDYSRSNCFGPGTTTPTGPSAINLRAVGNFVALTAAGAIANTGISTYNGDIATGLGAITAFDTAKVNGKILPLMEML
jgi:hypothetical protein